MVVERAQLIYPRRLWSNVRLRVRNVLAVLPATRIRTVGRSDKSQRVLNPVCRHLSQGVRQQRAPVAIAPVDWEIRTVSGEYFFERGDQVSILLVNWTDAPKHLVMMHYAEHALARHVAAAQHVFQEGNHVVHPFWSAKRDH